MTQMDQSMKFMIAIVLASTHALASPADDLFKAGQFSQSAVQAKQECQGRIDYQKLIRTTPEGITVIRRQAADACALAARATLTVAAYQTNDRSKAEGLITAALADTVIALNQTPDHVEATLQTAVALGYRAKLRQSPGIARQAKNYMDRATTLAPQNAFAALALAGWHGESVADVGALLARTVLGASKEKAISYYGQAMSLDPASPTIPVFYAFNLARLKDGNDKGRVMQLLTKAISLPPRDGFEAMNIAHAREVLASLNTGNSKQAKALIKRYQPFGVLLAK
jgi:tetratricopeptide (TPR) repeat protein